MESRRVTVISHPDFVELGAIPKTPLQKAMRVVLHEKSTAAMQGTAAAATRPDPPSRGTSGTTLTEPKRGQFPPGREPLEPLNNSDFANLLASRFCCIYLLYLKHHFQTRKFQCSMVILWTFSCSCNQLNTT